MSSRNVVSQGRFYTTARRIEWFRLKKKEPAKRRALQLYRGI